MAALPVLVAAPGEHLPPAVDGRRVRPSARHGADLVGLEEVDGLEPTLALLVPELAEVVGAADEDAPLLGDDSRVTPAGRDLDDGVALAAGVPQ